MKLVSRICLVCCLLAATAHRLPAPIQEIPESPAPTERAKKSRPKAVESHSKSTPKASPTAVARKFAGTWSGTIQTFPPGPTATALTVDSTETSVTLTWRLATNPPARAIIIRDTLQATFGSGIGAATFSLTPQPDGQTANVRMTAFMNDFQAVFRRISR